MKQTARNNAFLAAVKKRMTRREFQTVSDIFNAHGLDEAQSYIAHILDAEIQERNLRSLEEKDRKSEE